MHIDKARTTWAYRLIIRLLRPVLMIVTKRDWSGAENLPASGGYVVSPNHVSYADPLTFAHYLVDHGVYPRFLAKHGVFKGPGVGWLLHQADQIPVYRESGRAADAYRAAVDAIAAGKIVAIYPEGTLTRDPDGWPMTGKTGAARVALATRCPLVPIAQWGPQDLIPTYGHLPRLFPRRTMRVRAGAPVDLSDLYERPINREVLQIATDRLMAAITHELEVLRGETAPPERFDPRRAGVPRIGKQPVEFRDPDGGGRIAS